jgi:hypothetical protein
MHRFDNFHKTKRGLAAFGVVELVLAYGAGSWAINSGNLFVYLLTLGLFIGSLHNLYLLVSIILKGGYSRGK